MLDTKLDEWGNLEFERHTISLQGGPKGDERRMLRAKKIDKQSRARRRIRREQGGLHQRGNNLAWEPAPCFHRTATRCDTSLWHNAQTAQMRPL